MALIKQCFAPQRRYSYPLVWLPIKFLVLIQVSVHLILKLWNTALKCIYSMSQSIAGLGFLNPVYFPHGYPQSYLQGFQQSYPQNNLLFAKMFKQLFTRFNWIYPQ